MTSGSDFPDAPKPACARLIDARLHLLDRQMLDEKGEPVGIVDDLDIDLDVPTPRVTGIITGQVFSTRILGGQPPRSTMQTLSWDAVAEIGVVVKLHGTDHPDDGRWMEKWLRDNVIGRIPGGRHAAE